MDSRGVSLIILLILPALVCSEKYQENSNNNCSMSCPPWTMPDNDGTCQCGDSVNGLVRCLQNGDHVNIQVLNEYYITESKRYNETVLGFCFYLSRNSNLTEDSYYNVFDSANPTEDQDLCNVQELNRTGQLCGSCQEGYGLPVYSYSFDCVNCDDYKYNWLKYIAAAFLPLTLFYIAVVTFKISATSGVLCGYILAVQALTIPTKFRFLTSLNSGSTILTIAFKYLTLHAVWNLDFFRGLYPPFCLHPNLSPLQILVMDYAIAVYPFVLILVTYMCVKVHDHCPLASRLWRPFHKCFSLIHHEWNSKYSLIEVFSTFYLLSYTKIAIVSSHALKHIFLYNQQGTRLSPPYLYYDANVEYFGKEHLPYAIPAIFIGLVFNTLPLLILCLYPCRCFHRCLNACNFHSNVLHTFVESFQGNYKTEPRDLRPFAVLYVLIRFLAIPVFIITIDGEFGAVMGIIVILSSLLVAIYKPHKDNAHNILNAFILAWLGLFSFSLLTLNGVRQSDFSRIVIYALYAVGVLFEIGFIMYLIMPKHISEFVKKKFNNLSKCFSKESKQSNCDDFDVSAVYHRRNSEPAV